MFGKFNLIHTGRRDIINLLKKRHDNDFHRLFTTLHKVNVILKLVKYIFHYSNHQSVSSTSTGRRTQG